jgi:hypothetical protein
MSKHTSKPFAIWELPEVLLYQVSSFVAPPTERASFLCRKIAPLCKASFKAILEEEKSYLLWQLVLAGDYGVASNSNKKSTVRSCKRLKRSPVDQVKDAHKLLKDNTEIAYFYFWELSYSSTKNSLTKSKLCGILNEYGPQLMLNKTVSSGGTFLVEVCRARHTTQTTILHCVQELIERRGAMVNYPTNESANSSLTALCVAAVRAMPKVVEYLLSQGARREIQCSARFRLYTNPRKSVSCTNSTPLEFARSMLKEEKAEGASEQDLRDLNRAIKLLEGDLDVKLSTPRKRRRVDPASKR